MTVAHHLAEEALDHAYETLQDFDCAFEVTDFHLYVHGDDGCGGRCRRSTSRG